MSRTKSKVISELAQENSELRGHLHQVQEVFKIKVRAISAYSEIMERLTESTNEESKKWLATRLISIFPLFDVVDSLQAEIEGQKVLINHLSVLNDGAMARIKEDEEIISVLVE